MGDVGMKGVVFTEFMEMMDDEFGPELAEQVLEACHLPSGGIYTSVGSYAHDELLTLLQQLSEATAIPTPELARGFGRHLFDRFAGSYAHCLEGVTSSFQLLERADERIPTEVQKVYPEAELPRFQPRRLDARRMQLDYRSTLPFGDLAEGLIHGCAEHYGERIEVERESLAAEDGTAIRFRITRLD
jgi:hypothetical protein